jgi:hypothetical protein|nr:MAG TPA: hypothetical protein [Caudoviricetes sp.]DAT11148.1 MAG TPA: hypothetical protein [Caudoviricetes sp.]
MDLKLNNSNGEIYINKGDVDFFKTEEKHFEIIQQIVLMLHIREGELEYDVKYGLNFEKLFGTHGNVDETMEHVRNKIFQNFKDYLSKCYIIGYDFVKRKLSVNIGLQFKDGKKYIMKGVGIGWQE